jgi:predicted MFS family arabinose efflux permease
LCGTVLLVNLGRVVFAPLLSEFIVVFETTEATVGVVTTFVWVGSALPRLPTGWLLTRYPRHRIVLGAGVLLGGAGLFTSTARTVPALAVGAATMGLSSGVYLVAGNPLVAELYPDRVGRMMGIHGTAAQIAAAGAAPFAALVLSVLGLPWRVVFLAIGVAALVVAVVLFVAARRATIPDAGRGDRDLMAGARAQWRVILVGVAILGSVGFVWQGLFNFYELYLRAKSLPQGTAKLGLTLLFGAGVPAFVISGRLSDRLPRLPYALGVCVVFVACVFVLTTVRGVVPLAVVTVAVGYAIHSLFPALDAYLLDVLPDEHRGSAYAVYSAVMMLMQAPGASVVGALVEAGVAYDRVFVGMATVLAVVITGLAVAQRAGYLPQAEPTGPGPDPT